MGADHLHGPAGVLHLAHAEVDATDQAEADRAGVVVVDRLDGGRRRRRGQGRADRGRRVPARPRALPRARRARSEGHPAARPPRHRQDAARQGGRGRVGSGVLLPVRGLVRRDVRRARRRTHPAPVRGGAQGAARDHLHRRARRGRRRPRLRQQLRARADAQPAARRDGRLQLERRPRRDRGVEPARQARPGAAAPGPLRSPDLRLTARRRRPRGDPQGALALQAAGVVVRPRHARASDLGPDRRRAGQHLQRGGDRRRAIAPQGDPAGRLRRRARARDRRHAVAPRAQRSRAPRGRVARGGACALRRAAAGRRPRAQDLDRPARPGARLHAQPARGGPLPQDARGAGRHDDDAAGRARSRRSCSVRSRPAHPTTCIA